MSIQTTVRAFQTLGFGGEFYDSSPRRVSPYVVKGNLAASAVGVVKVDVNPTANDTLTVGSTTYTFVSSSPSDGQIQIGADAEATANAIAAALEGATFAAEAEGDTVKISVKAAGVAGNATALSASNTASITTTAFAHGAEADTTPATVGRVFTASTSISTSPYAPVPTACVGGKITSDNVFAGVLVNPKEYVNYSNLEASYALPNDTRASLCSMGHILVVVEDTVVIGQQAIFEVATGKIKGLPAGGLPAGWEEIPGGKFVLKGGSAGEVAVLELVVNA